MNITVEQTMEMPDVVLFARKLDAALKAEQKKRQKFYSLIDDDRKMEFINGEIYFQSPAKLRHTLAVGNLASLLRAYVSFRSLGTVASEKLLVSLTRNDYEPDICFFKAVTAKKFKPDQMQFPAPDLVVEVLSQSTERHDRKIKFEDYASHGVTEYWIIDPKSEVLEQYELNSERYELLLKSGDGMVESVAVRGFAIPIRAIFKEKANLEALRSLLGS